MLKLNDTFKLAINVDAAAFGDNDMDRREEVARILEDAARKVRNGDIANHYVNLYDYNGNAVGKAAFKSESYR